ncbi:hypothetical protein [Clostridium sp. Ade.TY]|uniref:hypothetical protein n=1 Tax=Clostridium sp. Ade.TY TaxID=1391647 RepID=UPI00041EBC15|nr:hypothetical protein [Clostridium sp. Ade.TY]
MRGQILDINNLEAFIELENGSLISRPLCEIAGASIGDHVSVSVDNISSPSNHNFSKYIVNPLMHDFF